MIKPILYCFLPSIFLKTYISVMRILKYLLLLWLIVLSSTLKAKDVRDSTLLKKITAITAAVSKKLVPDQRTDLFLFVIKEKDSPVIELETTLPDAGRILQAELLKSGLTVPLSVKLLPEESSLNKNWAVVRLSVANNRKNPNNAAEMVTQTTLGTPLQVLKKQRGYSLVRSPDSYISWVDNDAIEAMDSTEFISWQNSRKLIITADFGFSFSEPAHKALRVSDLVKGNIVKLLGKKNRFYKIGYPDNRIGYIPVKEAEDFKKWSARPDPDASQILATAKTLIGVPYLWGGTSAKGVDCSGFTKTSYFLNGIVIPRDASQQATAGEAVDIYEADTVNLAKCIQNLQAGDLLFFGSKKTDTSKEKVTHTAIYIGDGVFIQAAGMVRINSMVPTAPDFADYQARSLLSARRMLNAIGKPQITRVDQNQFYTKYKREPHEQ